MNLDTLKREEERKREAAYDPVQRWLHLQQTMTWAEANLPPLERRNRPRTARTCPASPSSRRTRK
jgi:hypothetical protein